MGEWVRAGGFQVYRPEGPVRAVHKHQAVGVRGRLVPGATGMMLGCSAAEWMKFVGVIKSGRLDMAVPGGQPLTGPSWVVMAEPPSNPVWWGPFPDQAVAARFATFVTEDIDPASVSSTPPPEGTHVMDPVHELLAARAASRNPEGFQPR